MTFECTSKKHDEIKKEQARRRKLAKEQREKTALRKSHTRRCIILGEILLDTLPETAQFKIHRTKAANDTEFKPLKEFLNRVLENSSYSFMS
ncbi:MAG: hypothetical protein FWB80_08080 [Defluviitaleaceae bacterium]|nr:hypothetical protein [Defluviitaleaceae bacterium]